MKHGTTQAEVWCYFLSSPIQLVASCPCEHAAHCGCMNNSLVLNTRSTGAEVAGLQRIFSNSSCNSANSFFCLTRSQSPKSSLAPSSRFTRNVIVIIILCLQNAFPRKFSTTYSPRTRTCISWSSMTRTFLKDNNTVIRDLDIFPGTYCVAWHLTQCF